MNNCGVIETYYDLGELKELPLIPKNPYNNLPLNISTLYNIYFFIRFKICVMPKLIQGYFLSNLDLTQFEYNNEGLIRETFIKNYIFTTHYETLHPIIINMLNDYKIYNKKLFIHEDFPKDKLVDIMRPYLHLYYLSKYYISGSCIKQCSTIKLQSRLRSFVNFNPNFGKKKLSPKILASKRTPTSKCSLKRAPISTLPFQP